jgi:hypothetical protein
VGAGLFVATRFFGDAPAATPDESRAMTVEIANAYAAGGNADAARAALLTLPVANAEQWLLIVTEEALANPATPGETRNALVQLALELGLSESTLTDYAAANGLLPDRSADAATLAAVMNAPVADAGAPAAAPTAQPANTAAEGASALADAAAPAAGSAAAESAPAPAPAAEAPAAEAAPVAEPTATPAPLTATTAALINLRGGPGTTYALAGAMGPGDVATILARNPAGDWLQIQPPTGSVAWVLGELVTPSGATDALAVAADIPPAPAPVAAAPAAPAAPAEAPAAAPPAEAPPAAAPPAEAPPAEAAPPAEPAAPAPGNPSDTPTFSLVQRRMWNIEENGTCRGQHLLRINVVDANNNPLNGITLQGLYTGVQLTTGDQGKGDGRIEFDLYGSGEAFKVARNNDGRDVISDEAGGFTTQSRDIDFATLIGGGYCSDDTTCQTFYNSFGCNGHHSWEATFKRNY